MRHGSLFSGIGGFDLAAEWMGWENVFQVEKDEKCQRVLRKNFPNAKIYGDIREFDGSEYRGSVDIITGGFPCQDVSVANPVGRPGLSGEHTSLWSEMLRVIQVVYPSWIVVENVYGLVTNKGGMELETVCLDLEKAGYEVQPLIAYSSAVRANHHRKRLFAYATRLRDGLPQKEVQPGRNVTLDLSRWDPEPGIPRVYDGLPEQLDKSRLKQLGNTVDPRIVYQIFKAIEACNE